MEDPKRTIHACQCRHCRQDLGGDIAEEHQAINRVMALLEERARRLFAGLLAIQLGRGGLEQVVAVTGLCRNTVRRGRRELLRADPELVGRVRRAGGGRQRVEKKIAR